MSTNGPEFLKEKEYLDGVLRFLRQEIGSTREALEAKKKLIYRTRQDQGVLTVDITSPGRSSDLTQHLLEDQRQLMMIDSLSQRLYRDEQLLPSPYFGRFDFTEDGENTPDKIYIGLHNLYDSEGDGDILVYDWRAPICSIFYRNEPGRACYKAPGGEICGDVTLKRQYGIEHAQLKYFFDCSLIINDDILKDVLAKNASPKMQNIVKTIQSEQDKIIRDMDSDLLMAQGAAGSGKTTIALHRIAYLLYNSAVSGLQSKNIVIISLSSVFSDYISSVLPQLGEKNVKELTFEEIGMKLLGIKPPKTRLFFDDSLLLDERRKKDAGLLNAAYLFKGSRAFAGLIKRFLRYYERRLIKFEDINYGGKIIAQSGELKNFFLNDKSGAPALSRLRRMEIMIKSKADAEQPELHKRLQKAVSGMPGHATDYKAVARLFAIKETKRVEATVKRFTSLNAEKIYRALFSDKQIFLKLCSGLDTPQNIEKLFDFCAKRLLSGIDYDDMAPLCFLALLLDRTEGFEDVKQVVVDEAQDYLPMHYAVLGMIFKGASFTVLGDIGQSVETNATPRLYEDVAAILKKRRPVLLNLKKSYRCSYEIMNFALKIPDSTPEIEPFERHEEDPEIIRCDDDKLAERLCGDIKAVLDEGFGTAAVICRTNEQAKALYEKLRGKIVIRLLDVSSEVGRGAVILPAYLSKGLEFDCVFVPDVDDDNYGTPLSKRLLYIACTRALHRLNLYYSGKSKIIDKLCD